MKIFYTSLAAALTYLMVGCAGLVGVPQQSAASNESQASERAEARWKAMIAKDLDLAYTFLSPGSKALNSPALFKAKFKLLNWKSAKAVSASCVQDTCQVKISLTFDDPRLGGEVTTILAETWLRDSSQWWLVFN